MGRLLLTTTASLVSYHVTREGMSPRFNLEGMYTHSVSTSHVGIAAEEAAHLRCCSFFEGMYSS